MSYGGAGVPEIEPDLEPSPGQPRVSDPGRRGDGARSVWIAVVSTVVFFAIVVGGRREFPGVVGTGRCQGRCSSTRRSSSTRCPKILRGLLAQREDLPDGRGLGAVLRASCSRSCAASRGRCSRPLRVLAVSLFDPVPRRADDPRDLHPRVRDAGARTPGRAEQRRLLGHHRAHARLHRIRRRGLQGGHRVGASRARRQRLAPWGSSGARPSDSWCCRRRSGGCSHPCSTTSSGCRRTPRWWPSSA